MTDTTDLGLHSDAPWCCADCGYPPDACGCTTQTTGRFTGLDHEIVPRYELERLRMIERRYEALCRAECSRQGIPPDEVISDGGHEAWELVGYEAARREMPDVE